MLFDKWQDTSQAGILCVTQCDRDHPRPVDVRKSDIELNKAVLILAQLWPA